MQHDDFHSEEKIEFPPEGSTTTPPHTLKKSFEFKDYAGKMFEFLRREAGISAKQYLSSLAGNLPYLDFVTNSKSGQFFFFSYDKKFLLKTQAQSE